MNDLTSAVRRGPPAMPVRELAVVGATDVAPRMRRVVLTGDGLEGFAYLPGQSMILQFPISETDRGKREYTIRQFDAGRGEIALDVLLHGATPGPEWARQVQPGHRIQSRGPRGRTVFRPADWHLFLGDESCIPAILHILETMPADSRAFAFIEVAGVVDEMPLAAPGDRIALEWLHRGVRAAGPNSLLLDRLAGFPLPQGHGQAYVIGETSNVRAQRHHLLARGLTREQIASEGYWRPGRIGGHDHVDD